jgi:hypothetical protein
VPRFRFSPSAIAANFIPEAVIAGNRASSSGVHGCGAEQRSISICTQKKWQVVIGRQARIRFGNFVRLTFQASPTHRLAIITAAENHFLAANDMMYYNFVRLHKTLRVTPAMAANVTKRLWEMSDIVDVLEAWESTIYNCRLHNADIFGTAIEGA